MLGAPGACSQGVRSGDLPPWAPHISARTGRVAARASHPTLVCYAKLHSSLDRSDVFFFLHGSLVRQLCAPLPPSCETRAARPRYLMIGDRGRRADRGVEREHGVFHQPRGEVAGTGQRRDPEPDDLRRGSPVRTLLEWTTRALIEWTTRTLLEWTTRTLCRGY